MATHTFDPTEDGVPDNIKTAEANALEVGEKIIQAEAEDRARKYQQTEDENELIAGKFKTQDDLLKAYEELQRKLSSGEEPSEEVDTSKEGVEQETPEEPAEEVEVTEAEQVILRASKAYEETGDLSEESIEELSKMDSKDLIKAYLSQYKKNAQTQQVAQTQQAEAEAIINSVGGADKYQEMIAWAGQNMTPDEINAYNAATNAGAASARFAVEALSNRYKASEGYEAPLVRGKATSAGPQPYRSNAELARDIADPRYHADPAFRMDVEARLARSTDLL